MSHHTAIDQVTIKRFDWVYSSDIQEIPFLFKKFVAYDCSKCFGLFHFSIQQYSLLETVFPFEKPFVYSVRY